MPFVPDRPTTTKKTGFVPDKKTVGGFLGNVAKSAGGVVSGIASAVTSPIQTAKNIGNTALGGVQLLIPGEQGREQYARNVGNFYKDRYGSLEKIGNTLYNDPVGVALDASTVLGGAGALAKTAGLAKAGKTLSRTANIIDPLAIPGRIGSKFIPKVQAKVGKVLETTGENMAFSGLHDPKLQKQIKGISGKTPLQLSQEYGTWDRLPETAQKAVSAIDELRKSKLVGKSLDIRDIMSDIDSNLKKLEGDISDSAKIQREYLTRKKTDIANAVMQDQNGVLSTPFVQPAENIVNLRKQIGKDIPESKWNIGSADSAKGTAAKSLYNTFKDRINTLDPSLKQAGKDESALLTMKKLFENEQARSSARNNIGLGDMVVGATTFSAKGLLPAMGAVAAKRLLATPKAVEFASKGINRAGKAIQKVKIPTSIKNISGGAYNLGRAGRMVNSQSQKKEPTLPKTTQIVPPRSYTSTIPPIEPKKKTVTKEIKIKLPKNTFSNKSTFGKTPRLKAGSFN